MKTNPATEIFLVAIVAVSIICVGSTIIDSPFDNQKFDSNLWTKNKNHKSVRGKMALDLCKKINEKPMRLSDIHQILGKPDDIYQSVSSYDIGNWENGAVKYYLSVPVDSKGYIGKAEIKKAD